jgi:ATP/maltotriose-dependent transcriptional regulator MalT
MATPPIATAWQFPQKTGTHIRTGADLPVLEPLIEPLSIRELDVLRLMALGHSNAEIAQKLVITMNTTKKHVTHIFGKLDVNNRSKAVNRARELRLVM